MTSSNLVFLGSEHEQVERDSGDDVDEEPALEVMHGYATGLADDLVVLVHVCSAEVDQNVDDEHHVHQQVYYH